MAAKKKTSAKDAPGPIAAAANKLDPPIEIPKGEVQVSKDISLHRLETAVSALEGKIPNILKLEAAAGRIAITDEVSFNKGSTFVAACDRELDQVEALRKAIYQPIYDYGKLISATFAPYKQRLEVIRQQANELMTTWFNAEETRKRKEVEDLRKQQEEEARARAAKLEKKGETDLAQQVLDAALSAPAPAAPVLTGGSTVNALGGKTVPKKVWHGYVEDREAVLRGILEGKIPWIVIEFRENELHTVARQVNAEGVFHGIRVKHENQLTQRKGAW